MKINHNNLVFKLSLFEETYKNFFTLAGFNVDWNSIPNSKLEILNERADLLIETLNQMFELLETYEIS